MRTVPPTHILENIAGCRLITVARNHTMVNHNAEFSDECLRVVLSGVDAGILNTLLHMKGEVSVV